MTKVSGTISSTSVRSYANSSPGGAPVKTWVLRACIVQGTQQIYISALWYWGSALVKLSSTGIAVSKTTIPNHVITALTLPLAVLLWAVGIVLFVGLPSYYRQQPGHVPSFYKSIFRRKIILWFFVAVIIQNYFLSAPYGRNWKYLWTTQHAPAWAIALLVVLFFIFVWAGFLVILSRLTKITLLDPTGLRHRSWCSQMVPDALGNIRSWSISPMGGLSTGIGVPRSVLVAVVGSSRRSSRCRLRDDPPPNHDPLSHNIHPNCSASPGLHLHHPRTLNST